MDVTSTVRTEVAYGDAPPLVLAASSDSAMRRAKDFLSCSGLRVGAALPLEQASDRLAHQGSTSAVWIEVDRDGGEVLDTLLDQIGRDADCGRYPAIVAITGDLIDPVIAKLDGYPVEILVDADDAERTAALAVATSGAGRAKRVSDVATDRSAEQLRQLSEEVNRIATMLSRLSTAPAPLPSEAIAPEASGDVPPVSAETVRKVIRARRLRARHFPEHLFADPAWDMLLDLFQAQLSHLRVPVSSLCIAASVPATTALRWLKTMVSEGLFVRRADPHDGRRVFVELSPEARDSLHRYFADVEKVAVI